MDELARIAKAYYDSGSEEQRRLYRQFFRSMKQDANSQVRLGDFLEFMRNAGHQNMCNRHFFNKLDRDRSRGLDYFEVMTLYYIIKSGRPFCGQCGEFIAGLYFTCTSCFNHSSRPFSVCLDCYRGRHRLAHDHQREEFLDNFALLEANRKSVLARVGRQNRNDRPSNNSASQAITTYSQSSSRAHQTASTSVAIVPAERVRLQRPGWREAYRALDAVVKIAILVSNCTIM